MAPIQSQTKGELHASACEGLHFTDYSAQPGFINYYFYALLLFKDNEL